jgi:hypothetical protein
MLQVSLGKTLTESQKSISGEQRTNIRPATTVQLFLQFLGTLPVSNYLDTLALFQEATNTLVVHTSKQQKNVSFSSKISYTHSALSDFKKLSAQSTYSPQVSQIALKPIRKPTAKATYCYSAESGPVKETSPYKPQANGDANGTYIRGYTGFVPRLQMHFGQPYSKSVTAAIKEFNLNEPADARKSARVQIDGRPIPGSTIFIPGSKFAGGNNVFFRQVWVCEYAWKGK